MAEARREEEGEGERRDLRDVRNRSPATDHPERTKPDHLHSSQGPLSSIRAAIKRQTRANPQSDHTRERRRPEITIVSAEPLASNNWFPGTSVVFPRPPQSGWSAGIQTVSQPPPSYDQVIQEKTQEEHIVKPTAAPRRTTCTTTSATQTDPVREDPSSTTTTVPQCSAAPQSAVKRSAGKTPQKPPRPSLPKPVATESAPETVSPADEKVGINTAVSINAEDQSDSKSHVKHPDKADSTHTCSRSVTVHWDIPTKHLSATAETPPSPPDSEHSRRPVPRPRKKPRKQVITEEVKEVQTLVKLSEHCDDIHSDPEEVSSNKYLKELLEVFSADNECKENGNIQSDEALQGEDAGGEMTSSNNQRNIQARIQAFETVASTEEGNAPKPEPRPRKAKPPVAAKPSAAPKPQLDHTVENDYQNVSTANVPQTPAPAPRPQPLKKPVDLPVKEELETLFSKTTIPNRSRPSVLTRVNSIHEEDDPPVAPTHPVKPIDSIYEEYDQPVPPTHPVKPINSIYEEYDQPVPVKPINSIYEEYASPVPPTDPLKPINSIYEEYAAPVPPTHPEKPNKSIHEEDSPPVAPTHPVKPTNSIYEEYAPPVLPKRPVKPVKEPLKPNLNINNHNSASRATENMYVDNPSNRDPVKPQRNEDSNGGSFTRKTLTRRPTTIRVPSQTGSLSDSFQDSPPPLPAQKAVGSLNTPVNHSQTPTPPHQESFQFGSEPSLPPRRLTSSKTLPARPPPAKVGPGRPPAPSLQALSRSHSVSWEAAPKTQAQKPHGKGPVLPPRPNPGHRLYNKYTYPLSHGIAAFDYNGSNTGELSFQQNEVLLLLEEIDHKTFQCQVGDATGRVDKSRIKVINPLSSVSHMSPPQAAGPAGSGGAGPDLKVQATHDFSPEGQGELGLRTGDVVTMVQQVDSEWYRGTCRGSTGFFPVNHVKVLTNSPKPLPERKAKPPPAALSGPRCVARFDFEGENSDELSFSEGDVIQLKAYVGQEWARGQRGVTTGIFPINFVEVIEDLPPATSLQKRQSMRIPLPGMVASPGTHPEVAKPAQASQPGAEWVVALYDFAGTAESDLSFQQGDRIQISQHIDAEWSCGRLKGREGMFPRSFVESSTDQQSSNNQPSGGAAAGGGRARAMFNFTSECNEELSLRVGDIITGLETVDEEWFLGDLRGKRALVPKNYVQIL